MFSSNRILLASLSLALVLCNHGVFSQEAQQEVEEVQSSSSQRRELWDGFTLFSMLMQRLDPCNGPDPLHMCRRSSSTNGDDDGSGDDDTSGSSGSSNTQSSNYDASQKSDYSSESESTADAYNEDATFNAGTKASMTSQMNMWLFATVGSVIAALGAIHIGQRKNPNGSRGRHEMTGVITRRATLVSAFATGFMPTKETLLPDEGVEMSPGLSLDYGPSGDVEVQSGYNIV